MTETPDQTGPTGSGPFPEPEFQGWGLTLVRATLLPAPTAEVWAWHDSPDALTRLIPPWEKTIVVDPPTGLGPGVTVRLRTRVFPGVWMDIRAEHVEWDEGRWWIDEMRGGPFARWRHRHAFLPAPREEGDGGGGGCLMRDEIEYLPPLGFLGRLVDPVLIRPRLARMFDHRHAVVAAAFPG